MLVLELRCLLEEKDLLLAELWEHGTLGVTEQDTADGQVLLDAYFADGTSFETFSQRFPTRVSEADEIDWVQATEDAFPAITVGERFLLVPEWSTAAPEPGRLRLPVHPGLACGTGFHPATQLCLRGLEQTIAEGDFVLDVGTGSGLLSTAAVLLGAARVAGCDVDPDAVAIARTNLALDDAAVPVFVGSAKCVRAACCDVVVANISAQVDILLAGEFFRVLKPGAAAILAGFELNEEARVTRAQLRAGLILQERIEQDGWSALVLRRPT